MRLCVNKNGERQDSDVLGSDVFTTNILTVIASESYDQFAKQLQTEIAEVVGDRPVKVTLQMFIDLVATTDDGCELKITKDKAIEIQEELIANGYVKKGELTEKYFND